ncbi:hypothetical protein AKJ09_00340 [Labilithrix luteola]|uniref:Uncharacterized protein n=1 Tax=Labilithrix luteola TaxID=1391654 RepID=A0A0K1PJT9_9BACT|nr:hypothetical protein [Labilithrix luteola]AKU93676.1 hypothetical protein AKJ09_00340 [Labilithrix luteola]
MEQRSHSPIEVTSGWDVLAAIAGLAVALVGQTLPFRILGSYYVVLWVGAPALAVVLRQRYLPQLTPPPPTRLPSTGRYVLGLVLMIGSGFVAAMSGLVAGIICVGMAESPRMPTFGEALGIGITLGIFSCALYGVVVGLRNARRPTGNG